MKTGFKELDNKIKLNKTFSLKIFRACLLLYIYTYNENPHDTTLNI